MKNISTEFHPNQGKDGKEEENEGEEQEEDEKARCEWDFKLTSIVSSSLAGAAPDTLGVIEIDPSDHLLVTGGIARKIRFYALNSLISNQTSQEDYITTLLDHKTACDHYICTPAKLSSLRWRLDSGGRIIGSGDYDGVITEYDLERRIPIFERDEHGGRRVWSIDYSSRAPPVGASGSDDGTTQVWDPRCGSGLCVAMARPGATLSPVCCVEFNPFNGSLMAVGCADKRAYTYDLRKMSAPVAVFCGHRKTVTYVRFLEEHLMVSAGTDGCLKLWDMREIRTIRTYKGHINSRNFVGLSVWLNGGLFGCGSESNEVFVYDKRWGKPIWFSGFEPVQRVETDHRFISSVCWRRAGIDKCILVAGGSDGVLQVFVGNKVVLIR